MFHVSIDLKVYIIYSQSDDLDLHSRSQLSFKRMFYLYYNKKYNNNYYYEYLFALSFLLWRSLRRLQKHGRRGRELHNDYIIDKKLQDHSQCTKEYLLLQEQYPGHYLTYGIQTWLEDRLVHGIIIRSCWCRWPWPWCNVTGGLAEETSQRWIISKRTKGKR